jgi:hypothetical protein
MSSGPSTSRVEPIFNKFRSANGDNGRYWHEPADPRCPLTGRYRGISGQHVLNVSSSHFDQASRARIMSCE